jgi:hypothetical protein
MAQLAMEDSTAWSILVPFSLSLPVVYYYHNMI